MTGLPHVRSRAWITGMMLLVVTYIVATVCITLVPTAYPRMCAPLTGIMMGIINRHVEVRETSVTREEVTVRAASTELRRFQPAPGRTIPAFSFTAVQRPDLLNVYPVVFIAFFAAVPASLRFRLAALPLALAVILLCSAAELAAVTDFLGYQSLSPALGQLSHIIPVTDENLAVMKTIQADADRAVRLKAFFTSGGRQLLPILALAIGFAPPALWRRFRRPHA